MSLYRDDNLTLYIVLGMIVTIIGCAVLFYGTIAAIAFHFIHKFW